MKNVILRFPLLTLFCLLLYAAGAQTCEYRLVMRDSFGDGWNGGFITLTSNTTVHTFFLADDGLDSTVFFTVTPGTPVQISWTPDPIYNSEASFELFNNDNDLLFSAIGPNTGPLYDETAACVACLKPANVQVENVYDTSVKLRWTPAGGSSNPVGWLVVYDTAGFTPGPGVGDSLYVTLPKAKLTGLTKKTKYEFYVQQDCGNGETGSLAGPFAFETYRSDDVGISGVVAPQSACDLGVETVKIVMSNFGANPQSLIPFNYSVNGIAAGVPQPQDGFYTGVLGKDSSTVIDFETTFDFSKPGEYLIAVWTEMKGDEFTANDTFYFRVINRLPAPYFQNFETWEGGWAVDTANSLKPSWQFGAPAGTVISSAASGKNAWVTNLKGKYNPNELSYLDSPCFDFTTLGDDPVIEFSLFYDSESEFDGGYLEMSLDEGNTWTKIGLRNEGLNWYSDTTSNSGDAWTGGSGGWITARHRLPGAAGKSPVFLRFVFASDEVTQQEGMGVDDVRIYEPFADDLTGLSVTTVGDGQDCGLASDTVRFRMTNLGSNPQSGFQVYYSVNGAAPVVENVGFVTVFPDQHVDYAFSTPFDSRDGLFEIKCWTDLSNDNDPTNDTATYTVNHLPAPVPVHEDFEAGLPADWITNGTVSSGHNNTSQVLAYRMNTNNKNYQTELPRVGFISAGDSLRFDYRIVNFVGAGTVAAPLGNGTHFDVQISTDCGQTFSTAYTINSTTHTPKVNLQTVAIDLSPFAGHSILIQFVGTWGFGDFYFDLDNINVRACAPDMHLSAQTVPADPGQSNGSATVEVGLGNPPYRFIWSTGDTTATAAGLPTGGPFTVTVTDDLGCSGVLTVLIGNSPVSELDGLTRLALQPNPTTGQATVFASFDHAVEAQVEVLDLMGRRIWVSSGVFSDRLHEKLDLSVYPTGIYLVRLSADGRSLTRKLIKN